MGDSIAQAVPGGAETSVHPDHADYAEANGSLAAVPERTGRVGLLPLTPQFDDDHHGLYVRHIQDALTGTDRDELRNIALTGSYGIGKSSILQEVSRRAEGRALSLSLSTLGDEPPVEQGSGSTPAAPISKTNRIQKEIVKQLLYREDPVRVPGSRYRRIGSFKWRRELVVAPLFAAVVVVLGYLTRFTDRLINFAGDNPLGRIGMHAALFVFVAVLIVAARWVFHNRFWVEKLIAGPATISLSNKSGSYFDEYLDEIVYFFEATDYDIAIFEDIDRFDDPHIFQTLRELNTILNNSKQLTRNIRFIYAIKDSIFEKLGADALTTAEDGADANGIFASADAAKAELERANRTKFFDLVIPVVPFITHRSARDHMTAILNESKLEVSRDLVELVSRHITDMRLIKNVHNEYGIFRERLLLPKGRLPGLTSDSLFAIVVYKNIHLSDFEKIKTGSSRLDELYQASRELVDGNVAQLDEEATRLRVALSQQNLSASVSETLGTELERYVRRVGRHQSLNKLNDLTFSFSGGAFTADEIRTANFWKPYVASKEQLAVSLSDHNHNRRLLAFAFEDVSEALGRDLSPAHWEQHDRNKLTTELKEIEKSRRFLLGADFAALVGTPGYKLKLSGSRKSLAEVCHDLMGSPLAIDLVSRGYIDRNFTLYTSQFQGVHVSVEAMNFILHHVQPNRTGVNFRFPTTTDIETVLAEVGPSVLQERSMYNIGVLDYLLAHSDTRCEPIIRNLSDPGPDENEFMTAYLARGTQREALHRRMAGFTPRIFQTIASMNVEQDLKVSLFNASLAGASAGVGYTLDGIGAFIKDNFASIDVLARELEEEQTVEPIMEILKELDVQFPSLLPLNSAFKRFAVENSLYDLTATNLEASLDGQKDFALDAIKDTNADVYGYVLGNPDLYVPLVMEGPETSYTINAPSRFIEILGDTVNRSVSALAPLARHAAPGCWVENIQDISSTAWPALARENRILPTFANLEDYVLEFSGIDENLAVVLSAAVAITGHQNATEVAKENLAILILNASSVMPDPAARVQLAESLDLKNYLDVTRIQTEPGRLTGLLIRDRIVDDTADSFELAVGQDWPTREFAIQHSTRFHEYLEPRHIPGQDLGPLMRSIDVPTEVKKTVLSRLHEIGAAATQAGLTEAASYAAAAGATLNEESLGALAAGKADPVTVVRLLEPALENLGYATVEGILKLMGAPYATLTHPGNHPVKLPRTSAHLTLARFVEKFGYASSNNWVKTSGLPEMKVFMKKN